VVLGVSRDSPEAQKKFKEKYQLPFPLLSDPDHAVHEAYGAWGEKNMYGKRIISAIRTTAVIGPDGKIEKLFPKVKVAGHAKAVLELLG
jgi:peroxiredoxin Q/BCP